jgi:hypothetical protein
MVTNARRALLLLAALTVLLPLPSGVLAAGPPEPLIGQPFRISPVSSSDTVDRPAVAHDPGRNRFMVVYEHDSGVNAVCLTAQGATVASYVASTDGGDPDVVYNGWFDEYLVVWHDYLEIWGARVGGPCLPPPAGIGAPFRIIEQLPNARFQFPAVAHNSHTDHRNYLVVAEIEDGDAENYYVAAQRVYSGGGLGAFYIITGTMGGPWTREPDVAYNLDRNEYLVVYTQDPSRGWDSQATNIYGRRVANSGTVALLDEHAIDDDPFGQRQPAAAANPLNASAPYLVVYRDLTSGEDKANIWGRRIGGDGIPLSGYISIAVDSSDNSALPAVAGSESLGGYTVAWSSAVPADSDLDVWARRVAGDGTLQDSFRVSVPEGGHAGTSYEIPPAVAGGSPVGLVVWQQWQLGALATAYDVYGRFLGYRTYVPLVLRKV